MSEKSKAMRLSFLLHSALLAGVVALSGAVAPEARKPVVIDFSLEGSCDTLKPEEPEQPSSVQKTMAQPQPAQKAVPSPSQQPAESEPVKEVATPALPKVQDAGSPVPSAVHPLTEVASNGTVSSVHPPAQTATVREAGARAASPPPAASLSPESKKTSYLKENFTYIRDMINRRISYPAVARKMGWEGRVTVSFVVLLDGSVRDIRVAHSSGRGQLDNNAVETVKNASPFPKPPVEAELVIPIVYRLN